MHTTNLRVGYSRRDMTPEMSVPLAGYGNTHTRMSQGWYSRLYATCIAITDEREETVLLITIDQIRCNQNWTDATRASITQATGIPAQRIMICATHTHSGPDIAAGITEEHPYYAQYIQSITDAAVQALEDRAATKAAAIGRTQVPGLTFVRHYRMKDGGVVGDNFGNAKGREYAGHTLPADEEAQLVRFLRDGKQDILLVNWQAHPTVGSTSVTETGRLLRPFLGADYIGSCRDYVEKETDCLFAFFLGAAGNLNSRSRIQEETPTTDVGVYGQTLGKFVVAALDNMSDACLRELKTAQQIYVGELDHTEDALVPQAREVRQLWEKENNNALCAQAGEPYGIHSAYHAGAIIRRSQQGTEAKMELNAISLGDLSIVTAPYEMFCNNARQVKDQTPYAMTLVFSCANDAAAYIASTEAFDHGCYEVDNRKFSRGTGEKAVACFLDMLTQLHTEE